MSRDSNRDKTCFVRRWQLQPRIYRPKPFTRQEPAVLSDGCLRAPRRAIARGKSVLTTAQDIATHFVRDILLLQPSGPFFLAGLCEGGIIALEIARQLQRQGHHIGALMQFDTPARGYWQGLPWRQRISWALARRENPITIIQNRLNRILALITPSTGNFIWDAIWWPFEHMNQMKWSKGRL